MSIASARAVILSTIFGAFLGFSANSAEGIDTMVLAKTAELHRFVRGRNFNVMFYEEYQEISGKKIASTLPKTIMTPSEVLAWRDSSGFGGEDLALSEDEDLRRVGDLLADVYILAARRSDPQRYSSEELDTMIREFLMLATIGRSDERMDWMVTTIVAHTRELSSKRTRFAFLPTLARLVEVDQTGSEVLLATIVELTLALDEPHATWRSLRAIMWNTVNPIFQRGCVDLKAASSACTQRDKNIYTLLKPSLSKKNKKTWSEYPSFVWEGERNVYYYDYCGEGREFGRVLYEYVGWMRLHMIKPCWKD